MRKLTLVLLLTFCMVMLVSGVAFAAHLGNGDRTIPGGYSAYSCTTCHTGTTYRTFGPHGGYAPTTNKCMACHSVHAAGNASLLPGTTVVAVCQYCHDMTQTAFGPYYMGESAVVKSAHRVGGLTLPNGYTNENGVVVSAGLQADITGAGIIPGGDATDGSAGNLDTTGQGKMSDVNFTCNSCHTPHAIAGSTVNKYLGESGVKDSQYTYVTGGYIQTIRLTDRILKNNPNNAGPVTEYGSAWCLTCHQGRDAIGVNHNHPVNENQVAYQFLDLVDPANWLNGADKASVLAKGSIVVDTGTTPAGTSDIKVDPRSNKQYAMEANNAATGTPHPDGYVSYATAKAAGGPSCQQCHGSARDLTVAMDVYNTTADGLQTTLFGNPQRLTFPHVSTNKGLLVQENDKFCTSCHGITALP